MSEAKAKAEKRVIQAIVPQRVALAESAKRHHVVTIQGSISTGKIPADIEEAKKIVVHSDDLLDPAFWALVAPRMTVGDTVEVRDDAMTYWGEFLVVACEPTWAKVEILREKQLATGVAREEAVKTDYKIEFKGPMLKYCVIRESDKEVVQQKLATREAAEDWLRDYRKAMRRAA